MISTHCKKFFTRFSQDAADEPCSEKSVYTPEMGHKKLKDLGNFTAIISSIRS